MASDLCMNCFNVKGKFEVCPHCGYVDGTPPEQPYCLAPGTVINHHFIVGTVIGIGGFGITYRCYDSVLGIMVAVKEFYPQGLVNRAPGSPVVNMIASDGGKKFQKQKTRFLMEARSIARFGKAKDIVNVFDYFEENQTAYIIMEYIDGLLLKQYMEKQGAMPFGEALNVIMPIIEAVKKIHSMGIIHRDISPDNIFITDQNSIKLFDFGNAILSESKDSNRGEKVVKNGFSAPEQYRDSSEQGFFTDVYSVGAILYQLITGQKLPEATERERKDEVRSPLEMGISINSNADKAIMEALAVDPELRFQGIDQFEEALLNKRVAEYPKDKVRNRRRKKGWIIGSSVAACFCIVGGMMLAFMSSKNSSKIFTLPIEDKTTITVWVENEDQKEQLDDLVENGFKQGSIPDQSNNTKLWKRYWKENEEVTVEVLVKEDMAEAISESSDENLPNMYITDHVPEDNKKNLVSIEKDVYAALNDQDYYCLDKETYGTEFPDYTELPTGLDTLMLYSLKLGESDTGKLLITARNYQANNSENHESTIKQSELIELFKKDYSEADKHDILTYDKNSVMLGAYLDDDKWITFVEKKKGSPECGVLSSILSINKDATKDDYKLSAPIGVSEDHYGNNIVAGAAFRRYLEKPENGPNCTDAFSTRLVTSEEGSIPVIYSEKYAIRDTSDEDQINACKKLLYVMMIFGQENKVNPGLEMTFPISAEQLKNYTNTHKNMTDFYEWLDKDNKKTLVGNGMGELIDFYEGIDDKGITDKAELEEYRDGYFTSSDKND